jgi:two-component system, chemotaxis family, sensor kinase CheA
MPTDTSKYLDLFISESSEHLDSLDAELIKFEKDTSNQEVMAELMRHAHTLKGIAASMGYGEISNLSHSFEGMVENIKNGLAKGSVQLLFGAVDELRHMVKQAVEGKQQHEANPLVDELGEMEDDDIETANELAKKPESFKNLTEIKVKTEKLNKIMAVASELTLNKMRLNNILKKIDPDEQTDIVESIEQNAKLIDELQYQIIQLRLMPLVYVFNRFPRMVRDLAQKESKEIAFEVTGGELELDRTILDVIGEPLVHLLRNAVDHGIESKGKINLTAKRKKDKAIIIVSDNGRGVDWEKLKSKIIDSGKEINEKTKQIDLLFSGVSTANSITEVSGRGVGMSIAKNKIEELGGKINVDSTLGKGTTFSIHLPISLAIVKVLLVSISNQIYAVPLTNVERLIDLSTVQTESQADQPVAIINDVDVPIINLSNLFNNKKTNSLKQTILLSKIEEKYLGFLVDQVLDQQDMVLKPISTSLRGQGKFSAMTILGDGTPVPIIDLESITHNLSK